MESEIMLDSKDLISKTPVLNNKFSNKILSKTPKKTPNKGDRFIPTRSAMDFDISHFQICKENTNPNEYLLYSPTQKDIYKEHLADTMFDGKMKEHKVLAFKNKAPVPKEHENQHKVLYSCNKITNNVKKNTRYISQNAEKILDAPNFIDDYYLNLIDWSSKNVLAIGLGNIVYLWNASTASIIELMKTTDPNNIITCVQWIKEGTHIAIGTNDGIVQLWDADAQKPLRMLRGHELRVGSLAWNNYILSSGSRDTNIFHHDVRIQQHHIATLSNHSQEICGLKWSDDGLQLASGGNDNLVNIWDINQTSPKFTFTDHQAAVKAIAWCPWQKDLLATGGGTADRTMKFWNTTTGICINSIDTQSQVSSLIWSKQSSCREIVSSHGFSQNQIIVWKYPSLVKVTELKGHEQRILSLSQSPDGSTIVSGAADETLRFWKIFDVETPLTNNKIKQVSNLAKLKTGLIR